MKIEHANPAELHSNPAYSQVIKVSNPGTFVQIGGQNAVDADGNLVGTDLQMQSEQALRNVLTALAAVGVMQENVTRLGIYLVAGADITAAFAAAQNVWGRHATTVTVLQVAALGRPEVLVEIEATAFIE